MFSLVNGRARPRCLRCIGGASSLPVALTDYGGRSISRRLTNLTRTPVALVRQRTQFSTNAIEKSASESSSQLQETHSTNNTFSSVSITSANGVSNSRQSRRSRSLPEDGITLSHFIASSGSTSEDNDSTIVTDSTLLPEPASLEDSYRNAYMNDLIDDDDDDDDDSGTTTKEETTGLKHHQEESKLKFHLKTYGCQMNVSDSDIVRSILLSNQMEETSEEMDADVILTNTCAIRENAEQKIWHRLKELKALDKKNPLRRQWIQSKEDGNNAASKNANDKNTGMRDNSNENHKRKQKRKRIVGVLGCMAERLKEDMFRDGTADLVVGPDAYRDLPRLIHSLTGYYGGNTKSNEAHYDSLIERAVNVQLSLDETYADVKPVRRPATTTNRNVDEPDVSAFVSVMRGCNNMCSYCVVPFTRGRERSRELTSIVDEIKQLHFDEQIKEIALLGQNVNSYHDKSSTAQAQNPSGTYRTSNESFRNMYRSRGGAGYYFSDLVEAVSDISPELRVRFTSPHPKDYPMELLQLMAERHNVCNQLHMPAQSGSTSVLERMRRGYSREAYLELMDTVHSTIPDVALSSDFITGFCGETEEEHLDTLSLMEHVRYDMAFMFAYSMRGKTHAQRTMVDDISDDIKQRRLLEVIDTFRRNVQLKNEQQEVGRLRVVLVEGKSRKSSDLLHGRTDQNKRILFQNELCLEELPSLAVRESITAFATGSAQHHYLDNQNCPAKVSLEAGDYAVVRVTEARGHVLKGSVVCRTTLQEFNEWEGSVSELDKISMESVLSQLIIDGPHTGNQTTKKENANLF